MLSITGSARKPLGGSARLGILRGGREQTTTVSLRSAPATPRDEIVIRSRSPFSGVKIANLSPALAEELQLQNVDKGVAIVDVDTGSYASNLGFSAETSSRKSTASRSARRATLSVWPAPRTAAGASSSCAHGQKISAVFSG
jgi:hypothetical protein